MSSPLNPYEHRFGFALGDPEDEQADLSFTTLGHQTTSNNRSGLKLL
ncbi:hypothetical protein [Streptococcus equi]